MRALDIPASEPGLADLHERFVARPRADRTRAARDAEATDALAPPVLRAHDAPAPRRGAR